MTWAPTSRKLQPDMEVGAKNPYKHVAPEGLYLRTFTMKVPEGFSDRLAAVANQLKGQWSKADILRLGLDRLIAEVNGEPRVEIRNYLVKEEEEKEK